MPEDEFDAFNEKENAPQVEKRFVVGKAEKGGQFRCAEDAEGVNH